MSPEEKLSQWRASQPPAEKRQRPQLRSLTEQELEGLKGLNLYDRLTKGRQMQQTPPPDEAA